MVNAELEKNLIDIANAQGGGGEAGIEGQGIRD